MKGSVLPLIALLLIASSSVCVKAQGWRGIIPLHSTRADVEKLLGPSPEPEKFSAVYDLGDRAISIEYSSGPCREEMKGGWNLAPETVVSLLIGLGKSARFPPSRIDKRKFKKVPDRHLPSVHYYVNREDGITYEVQEGLVQSVEYYAAAQDRYLLCPNQP